MLDAGRVTSQRAFERECACGIHSSKEIRKTARKCGVWSTHPEMMPEPKAPPSETEGGHPHGVPTKPREILRFARNDGLGLTTRGGNVRECRLKRQRTDGGGGRLARRPGRRRRGGFPGWWRERERRTRWLRRRPGRLVREDSRKRRWRWQGRRWSEAHAARRERESCGSSRPAGRRRADGCRARLGRRCG